jgi:hypothetical protein
MTLETIKQTYLQLYIHIYTRLYEYISKTVRMKEDAVKYGQDTFNPATIISMDLCHFVTFT